MAMQMVMRPERFDVVVTTIYGDVLPFSMGLVGGLVTGAANMGKEQAMFGHAWLRTRYRRSRKSNPMALLFSSLML